MVPRLFPSMADPAAPDPERADRKLGDAAQRDTARMLGLVVLAATGFVVEVQLSLAAHGLEWGLGRGILVVATVVAGCAAIWGAFATESAYVDFAVTTKVRTNTADPDKGRKSRGIVGQTRRFQAWIGERAANSSGDSRPPIGGARGWNPLDIVVVVFAVVVALLAGFAFL